MNVLGDKTHRLQSGGLIDRNRPLSFIFDGKKYSGFSGDTLASALLAEGVQLMGRSFKYHRPRGPMSAGPEEPNALVTVGAGGQKTPNTRATTLPLSDGLVAVSQNRWPTLGFDLGAINSLFSPFLVAGFYYKTFMWPAAFWEGIYEPAIRKAAGLGRSSQEPDPDSYEKCFGFCDLLVIGSGPSGLMAALAAARSGARVILCEQDFVFGGRLNAEKHVVDGMPGAAWAKTVMDELSGLSNVQILARTAVFGVYDGKTYAAIEDVSAADQTSPRQRMWKIVAGQCVLATGAVERPIVFGGNDRPGIMTAGAMRTYLNRFAVTPSRRVAIFTTQDDGWLTAHDLRDAGVEIAALIDTRPNLPQHLREDAKSFDCPVLSGAEVVGTKGVLGLKSVEVRDAIGMTQSIAANGLAVSGGWSPNLGLSTHLGGRPKWSDAIHAYLPNALPPGMIVVGAAGGTMTLSDALREGAAAGASVADALDLPEAAISVPIADDDSFDVSPVWQVKDCKGKAFVDFQNDVTAKDLEVAVREGFSAPEHAKRYTTLGMATDQGQTSNINGHAILAQLTGKTIAETGTTVSRPPQVPVALSAFAGLHKGKHFRPTRLTAAHGWAVDQGAEFAESGLWLRARWFTRPGETDWQQSVAREVRAVREGVGICDVSTLGKIDVQGSDAGTFLDRVYINGFSSLAVGKARYGVMLREDGFVFDDGVTARFAEDHYVMSTTTGNAGRVMQHLEHARQLLWPSLDVQLASVTEQWSQYAVAGPRSRELLARLFAGTFDPSNDNLPYVGCVELDWDGIAVRLYRVSFSGEMAFEIAVPARFGAALVQALIKTGADMGATPYGLEALNVMRIEKGHVSGAELNGTTTAADLGLGRMMSKKKDFIGRVLAQRPGLVDADRPALVGIKPLNGSQRLRTGAHVHPIGATPSMNNDQGYVSSVAYSPSLGSWIGLALVANGPERLGETVRLHFPLVHDADVEAQLVSPVFVDPDGERLRG